MLTQVLAIDELLPQDTRNAARDPLREAHRRTLQWAALRAIPGALWRALVDQGLVSFDAARFVEAAHWEGLAALVDVVPLALLKQRAQLPEAQPDEQRFVLLAVRRLALAGETSAALAMALRSSWSGARFNALEALRAVCHRAELPSVVEAIIEQALHDDAAVATRALCATLQHIDDDGRRTQLFALALQRVEALPLDRVDPFDNPWWWLAQAAKHAGMEEHLFLERARAWDATPALADEPAEEEPENFGVDLVAAAQRFASEGVLESRQATLTALRAALDGAATGSSAVHDLELVDPAAARRLFDDFMSKRFIASTQGWLTTEDGSALDEARQNELVRSLSPSQCEALIAHASPTMERRKWLRVLVEAAARAKARQGEVDAMRAHLQSIAEFSTTPRLEYEFASLLPEPLRQLELQRLFETLDPDDLPPLHIHNRRSVLFTCTALGQQLELALRFIEVTRSPVLRIECLGLLLRCADVSARAQLESAARRACDHLEEACFVELLSPNGIAALVTLESTKLREVWSRVLEKGLPPWPLTIAVLGRHEVERFARELETCLMSQQRHAARLEAHE